MNNNLYQWHNERMVDYEMQEIRRELAQVNLLSEAGLSGTKWLSRAANALVQAFQTRGPKSLGVRSEAQRSYSSHTKKTA